MSDKTQKELSKILGRLRRKMTGKVWEVKMDCTDPEVVTATYIAEGVEQKIEASCPEVLACLALLVGGAAVDFERADAEGKMKARDVPSKLFVIGNVLLRLWDDQEKVRAISLN